MPPDMPSLLAPGTLRGGKVWQDSCTHCGRGTPLVDDTLGAPEKSQLWADAKGQWHKDDFQIQGGAAPVC
ncbi:Guanine Nucleotide Exchange Factor Dbs [Manis pentadactyla]|nr:Guanine Nucleotide Exchange Factor Dbs [Manis pentadactyla]